MANRQSELGCKSKYGKYIVPIYMEEEMVEELERRSAGKFLNRQAYVKMAISEQFKKDAVEDARLASQMEAARNATLWEETE